MMIEHQLSRRFAFLSEMFAFLALTSFGAIDDIFIALLSTIDAPCVVFDLALLS